jgi:hypothetical protein
MFNLIFDDWYGALTLVCSIQTDTKATKASDLVHIRGCCGITPKGEGLTL